MVVNSDGKRPFGVLGANGSLESILILNTAENVGKNDFSQHVMGFRQFGNELSGGFFKVPIICNLFEQIFPFRD